MNPTFQNRKALIAEITAKGGTPPSGFPLRKELLQQLEGLTNGPVGKPEPGIIPAAEFINKAEKILAPSLHALAEKHLAATNRPPMTTIRPATMQAKPAASYGMPTAEAIAAEIIKQQAAAPKPLTGLAKVTAAFQKEPAEKAAKAKHIARNPEISKLTGLAKVTASFSAQKN